MPSRIEDVPHVVTEPEARTSPWAGPRWPSSPSGGPPVLVGATDGSLPPCSTSRAASGRGTMTAEPRRHAPGLRLRRAPDGRDETVAGVAVVDLASGEVARVAAVDGGGDDRRRRRPGLVARQPVARLVRARRGQLGRRRAGGRHHRHRWGSIDTGTVDAVRRAGRRPAPVGVSDDGTAVVVDRRQRGHPRRDHVGDDAHAAVGEPASDGRVRRGRRVRTGRSPRPTVSLTAVGLTVTADAAPVRHPGRRGAAAHPGHGPVPRWRPGDPARLGDSRRSCWRWSSPAPGSDAERGRRRPSLVLLTTSPDRPEAAWTYRMRGARPARHRRGQRRRRPASPTSTARRRSR